MFYQLLVLQSFYCFFETTRVIGPGRGQKEATEGWRLEGWDSDNSTWMDDREVEEDKQCF